MVSSFNRLESYSNCVLTGNNNNNNQVAMQADSSCFQIGEVVWAKITGYPWWPAQVFNRTQAKNSPGLAHAHDEYSIMFFGDNSHAYLPPSKLVAYLSKYDTLAGKNNTKRFNEAIAQANQYLTTQKGSLLEQEILIDSHPVCCFFYNHTTQAHEDKVSELADVEGMPETPPLSPSGSLQQNVIDPEFTEEDFSSLGDANLLELLQKGLVRAIRSSRCQQSLRQGFEEQLKYKLLSKYSLLVQPVEEPMPLEEAMPLQEPALPSGAGPLKRVPSKNKKCQRKARYQGENEVQAQSSKHKRLCVLKLHQYLKASRSERWQSIQHCVWIVERLCENFQFFSQAFVCGFKRLLRWVSVTKREFLEERMQDFVAQLVNNNEQQEKSRETVVTACSFK